MRSSDQIDQLAAALVAAQAEFPTVTKGKSPAFLRRAVVSTPTATRTSPTSWPRSSRS